MAIHLPKAIEFWPVTKLRPYAKNARTHSDEQIAQIAASIEEFGFTNPILVDTEDGIIAGHGRLEAAKKLNLEQVPVIVLDNLSDAQRRAYIIADNKLALNAGWDLATLSKEIEQLQAEEFDLELLGFSDDELADLLPETEQAEPQGDADEVPEAAAEPKVVRGEVYILGKHRLMCGDSTSIDDVEKLMDGAKADMVFTDPPYNHASDDAGIAAAVSKAHENLMNSDWDRNFSFLDVAGSITYAIKENAAVYVCTSHHLVGEILKWMKETAKFHGLCIWHKPNPMPSLMKRHWTWAHELVCYATFGKHTFNFPLEGHAPSVWSFTKKSDGSHPTQKPVEVCIHAIGHSSKDNDLVLDLFGGSGTTLVSCEQIGRRCRMMELDPKYCGVILDRWQKFTGKKAHREDGVPWDEIKGGD